VPTAALKVGTADPVPRINRHVAAAFAHPTHYLIADIGRPLRE
jgi:hypothetical protein